jgi:lipoate-protein ligase A
MLWINDPTIVIGRYQNTAEEVNCNFVASHNINVVRRITGGGAVYHDHGNLNYTVIQPVSNEEALNIRAFEIPLIEHLRSLGIKAECTGRNDITVGGRKFSGVAQYCANGVVLHHGTLLYNSKLDDVSKALRVKSEKFQSKGFKSVRTRVVNLCDFLSCPAPIEKFRRGLAEALIHFYRIKEVRPPSAEEERTTLRLKAEKYDTREWTWNQSPRFTYVSQKRFPGGLVQVGFVVEKGRITDCRIHGDYFALIGPEEVEKRLCGQLYPFEKLPASLDNELLERTFCAIDPEELRRFLME